MKHSKMIICFIITTLLLLNCNIKNEGKYVRKIWGKPIDYSMLLNNRRNMLDTIFSYNSNNKYKIVSYVDSLLCTPCLLGYLDASETYVDSIGKGKVFFICIIRPRSKNENEIRMALQGKTFSENICLLFDVDDLFAKSNKVENYPSHLRTFLLDDHNNVLLVGDPIRVNNVRDIYKATITKIILDQGFCQN